MRLRILTAADGAPWEANLLAALGAGDNPIEVVRRCVDVVDLLSAAAAGLASAVLVDAQLRRFDADCQDRLLSAGLAVVGVVEPSSDTDQDALATVGVQYFLPCDAPPSVVASVLEAAVRDSESLASLEHAFSDPVSTGGALSQRPRAGLDSSPEAPDSGHHTRATEHGAGALAGSAGRGAVIAVWGPTGAPGRTTVATYLADEIARLKMPALLVDADVYGGVLASVLGLMDESPGIAAACRQAQSRRLDASSLAALTWQLAPHFSVLTGISRADRWPELRPAAVGQVLTLARQLAAFTVVDLGFALDTDEELSFDTSAPRRNGATLAVLDEADLVLAVGSADPIGIQRLVRGLDELKGTGSAAPVWVVLNRVRRGPVPGDPAEELNAALARFAGVSAAALLSYDRQAVDSSIAAGRTLAETSPNSPLRRSIAELATAVTGAPTSRRNRRR